jgi:hypothetical protein
MEQIRGHVLECPPLNHVEDQMAETITIEITDGERAAVAEAVQPYRKQINETPALLSILYDIDLMPEQIRLMVNAGRMIAFCEVFKRLTPEQIDSLFSKEAV